LNKHLIAIAVTAIAVTGCAAPQTQSPAATEDLNVGIAKTCTPSTVDLAAAPTASATIAMTNDGWCAIHTKDKGGQPFLLGLVKANPAHGRILIQKIGGETRVEYTATPRYVGTDKFTVALRSTQPNTPDATVQVAVTVTMGEGMQAVEPPPPAPARKTTPARPARTTR
jgi:hypothetical protein